MSTVPESNVPSQSIEAAEEAKLKAKYPNLNMGRKGVGSSVLQKRINRGQKYFDSGDYNMARAKVAPPPTGNILLGGAKKPAAQNAERMQLLQESTGDTIPTPENVSAVRKRSMAAGAESLSAVHAHAPHVARILEQKPQQQID